MSDDIPLPPLPYPQLPGNDYTAADMRNYARAAVMAERDRMRPQWIACSDRMPPAGLYLVAFDDRGQHELWEYDAHYHWMPLPDGPEAER